MKKLITITILLAVMLLLSAEILVAATPGSCTQTTVESYVGSGWKRILFKCTGASDDGTLPTGGVDLSAANAAWIQGWQLFQVDAYPTAGGTAPDAADVMIIDKTSGIDLLGSVDASTAYAGLNLIHATLAKRTVPDIYMTGTTSHLNYFPYVTGVLTLKVKNQATVNANYTIVLNFFKDR